MTAEKDQKKAAQKCFDSVKLDPDFYRIGHTKARYYIEIFDPCLFTIRWLYQRVGIQIPSIFHSGPWNKPILCQCVAWILIRPRPHVFLMFPIIPELVFQRRTFCWTFCDHFCFLEWIPRDYFVIFFLHWLPIRTKCAQIHTSSIFEWTFAILIKFIFSLSCFKKFLYSFAKTK